MAGTLSEAIGRYQDTQGTFCLVQSCAEWACISAVLCCWSSRILSFFRLTLTRTLTELPLVIRDSQGNVTADPQCVADHYGQEWKREWGGEDTIGFNKEISSIQVRDWAGNLDLRAKKCSQSLSLFPVQDGDRPRPARIQRHRPPP